MKSKTAEISLLFLIWSDYGFETGCCEYWRGGIKCRDTTRESAPA